MNILIVLFGGAVVFGAVLASVGALMLWASRKRTGRVLRPGVGRSKWYLTSGRKSDWYYDIDLSVGDPDTVKSLQVWYEDAVQEVCVREDVDGLAFIEKDSGPIGALLLAGMLVSRTRTPAVFVRTRRRLLVGSVKSEAPVRGKNLVLISDVATTGRSVGMAIDELECSGARVHTAIFFVNRGGARLVEDLRKRGVKVVFAHELESAEDLRAIGIEPRQKASTPAAQLGAARL